MDRDSEISKQLKALMGRVTSLSTNDNEVKPWTDRCTEINKDVILVLNKIEILKNKRYF